MSKQASGMVFQRHEKKYRLTHREYRRMLEHLAGPLRRDHYGKHTICSVYYDTPDFALIRHSLDKPAFKEKFRLRSYGVPGPEDMVYLECKRKLQGITYKRRVPLALQTAENYLIHGAELPLEGQIFGEIDWFLRSRPLEPQVLLCYDRIAFHGIAEDTQDLRITFDEKIRWRNYNLRLGEGDYGSLLLPDGGVIMEIKAANALPYWLSRLLSEEGIYPASFSKYGTVYREHLLDRKEIRHAG